MSSMFVSRPDAVVAFRDHAFDRSDLVLVGFITGSWPAFEQAVAMGLACQREAGLAGNSVDREAIRSAADAFRRARGLLAGDELRAWLAERCLSSDDWTAYLSRTVLRQRYGDTLDVILDRRPVSCDEIAEVLGVDAACDGILRRCAETVVDWAATIEGLDLGAVTLRSESEHERLAALAAHVAESAASKVFNLGTPELTIRLGRLLGLQAAYERFAAAASGPAAIRACFDEHRLAWTRYRCVELCFDDTDAAREGAMCLREDRLEPDEVARLAGARRTEQFILLQEAEPPLASLLIAAKPGEVLGPLPDESGGSRLLVVADRVPPSSEDPALSQRARRMVVAAALEPLVAGRVRWHGPL